ncbi:unnamed protein product [Didymodactylos carnosus]|uniref:Nbr1 FW domain-containing protein n=1 Tax=Didymodactylos carnosus TaxID=1234261 RepID=A0A814TMS1_9BILA|nr:unnamed protein product [Didymodactylos carnosus]CAF1164304.1 unnamed protein product [Didymodactylos carnosus]CAF3693610.1 unnamed protein product [Didymodactylos carnosus]CAF3927896.1 unnamed protein product [Didymodactylos carnosus]
MDVDSESTATPTPGGTSFLDAKFLESFRSFTTDDREHLINQFRTLTNAQLTNDGIGFFLDMNNWNLNAAIVAYYDFEQPSDKFPMMKFVADVTVGEGEAVPPSTRFTKTWRIENSGSEPWPSSCVLKFVNGDRLQERDETYVGSLAPSQQTNVSIDMTSPIGPGMYKSQWRLFTSAGVPFGDPIWLIASVEEGGLLGITQQLSALGGSSSNDNDDNMMMGHQTHLPYNSVIHSSISEHNNNNNSNPFQMTKTHSIHSDGNSTSNVSEWRNYPIMSVEEFSRTANLNQNPSTTNTSTNATIEDNSLDTF